MNGFKLLLTITAIIAVPMGIMCMLFPSNLLAAYDVILSPMGLIVYQFWGVTIAGLGMLAWFLRNTEETTMQNAISFSLFITFFLSTVMAVRGQYAGANDFGWSTVALYFIFSIAYGLFLMLRRISVSPRTFWPHTM